MYKWSNKKVIVASAPCKGNTISTLITDRLKLQNRVDFRVPVKKDQRDNNSTYFDMKAINYEYLIGITNENSTCIVIFNNQIHKA